MKGYISEFIRRGLTACGLGPLVLVIIYLILQKNGILQTLTVNEVCTGIASVSALAFIAGGLNIIYRLEKLPLMMAILIHGIVLYICYLATYLINGWIKKGTTPILVFSVIFGVGYIVIWVIIYSVTKNRTKKLNEILKKKQLPGKEN